MERSFSTECARFARVWLVLLAAALAACSTSPPEARLRERIAEMQTALETRELAQFMDGVAEDFSSEAGLDRRGLHSYLRVQVLRHAEIGLTLGPIEVQMHGDRASAQFSVMATGGSGGLLPDSARPWTVRSDWRDGPDGWQVFRAQWQPAL